MDLRRRVNLRVDSAPAAVRQVLDAARFAEIDAAGELADDDDVEVADDLGLKRRRLDQRGEDNGRAKVGEQGHVLAQAQQAALGLLRERQIVPLRPTDSAEQHPIRGHGRRHGRVGQRHAVRIDGSAADQVLADIEADPAFAVEPVDHPFDFVHHLGPDAISWQKQELLLLAHRDPSFRCLFSLTQDWPQSPRTCSRF